MTPRRFRASRLSMIMRDPTRMAEVIIGFCNIIVPGLAMVIGRTSLPEATERLLSSLYLGEHLIGVAAVALGAAQLWGAGTDWYAARARIATAILCSLIGLITAYAFTGYDQRLTIWLMLGTIFAEAFLAWRCWHEKPPRESAPAAGRVEPHVASH